MSLRNVIIGQESNHKIQQTNKTSRMKKTAIKVVDYETPLVTTIHMEPQQCLAASSNLEDMTETNGEWAI